MKLMINKPIDQERFNKLKQLDRIEFRQKYNEIEKLFDRSIGFSFMKYLVLIIVIGILLIPQAITAFGFDAAVNLIHTINAGISIFALLTLLGFMIDLLLLTFKKKKLNELIESYFDFKLEVKK